MKPFDPKNLLPGDVITYMAFVEQVVNSARPAEDVISEETMKAFPQAAERARGSTLVDLSEPRLTGYRKAGLRDGKDVLACSAVYRNGVQIWP